MRYIISCNPCAVTATTSKTLITPKQFSKNSVKDNDVILIQGAGNIAELSDKFRTECVKANTLKNW